MMTIEFDVTQEDYVDSQFYFANRDKKANIRNLMNFSILSLAIFLPTFITFLSSGTIEYFYIFLAVLFLWAGIFVKTKRSIRKRTLKLLNSGRNAGITGMRTLTFTDSLLTVKNDFCYAEFKWSGFANLQESKELLLLFQTVNQAIIIPKRIFLLPQEEYDVKSFIERKLSEQKH